MRLGTGLVLLSGSHTNANMDAISIFRKMTAFEREGDRIMVLLTADSPTISQAVRQMLIKTRGKPRSLWMTRGMFEAVMIVGKAVCDIYDRDAAALAKAKIDFSVGIIFGGQTGEERPRLFGAYAAGSLIEATPENCYFQIGEARYGKSIIDCVVSLGLLLDEAVKCALISTDPTLKPNISADLPLDLLVYEANPLQIMRFVAIDEDNPYFVMIRGTWGKHPRQVFAEVDDPDWEAGISSAYPLRRERHPSAEVGPVRIAPPTAEAPTTSDRAPGPASKQISTIQRVAGGSQKSC